MLQPILMAVALATAQSAPMPQEIYHGRENEIAVRIPRLDGVVEIDGMLDEPSWGSASVLTGFSQYRPVDGLPAVDSTAVLV
ncbi:MAG: hypothetical protein ACREIV_09145, partial [Planctomycetaceae bacterium]